MSRDDIAARCRKRIIDAMNDGWSGEKGLRLMIEKLMMNAIEEENETCAEICSRVPHSLARQLAEKIRRRMR